MNKVKAEGSTIAGDEKLTRLLLISQPSTPRLTRIPATSVETRKLNNMMEKEGIESLLLEDDAATIARVTEEMGTHSWVHFACHAIQDQVDSLNSGVYLHDRQLSLLEMMKQRMPYADHAFLSACQTCTGDENLSDEAVHIAAGMLAVGYQGVVATMWSVSDEFGPEIAEGFYGYMLGMTQSLRGLDSGSAARALDNSIRKIRLRLGDSENALLIWVPYVHFGS